MRESLVLVSGLLSDERLWRYQMDHLSEISSIHIATPSQNDPKKMVNEVLKGAPSTFALAGHSMGGWLCLEIMRVAPSRVTKLCLLNTTAREDSEEKIVKRKQMIQRAKKGSFNEISEELADLFVFNPAHKKEVKEMFKEMGVDTFIRQEESMIKRRECQSILPSIQCPTLIIHAAQDQNFTLAEHEELAQAIPNAKLAIIDDSGHMSPIERPQAVTSLLRFWLMWF